MLDNDCHCYNFDNIINAIIKDSLFPSTCSKEAKRKLYGQARFLYKFFLRNKGGSVRRPDEKKEAVPKDSLFWCIF